MNSWAFLAITFVVFLLISIFLAKYLCSVKKRKAKDETRAPSDETDQTKPSEERVENGKKWLVPLLVALASVFVISLVAISIKRARHSTVEHNEAFKDEKYIDFKGERLKLGSVPGDGLCLFHSVSGQTGGTAITLAKRVVAKLGDMIQRRDFQNGFLTLDDLQNEKSRLEGWISSVEKKTRQPQGYPDLGILGWAIAEVEGRDVVAYDSESQEKLFFKTTRENRKAPVSVYRENQHFVPARKSFE